MSPLLSDVKKSLLRLFTIDSAAEASFQKVWRLSNAFTVSMNFEKSIVGVLDPIALARTGRIFSNPDTSVAVAACSKFNGIGNELGCIPEWQSGTTGISRIHPAPASKLIHGRLMDEGLHTTISTVQVFKAVVI